MESRRIGTFCRFYDTFDRNLCHATKGEKRPGAGCSGESPVHHARLLADLLPMFLPERYFQLSCASSFSFRRCQRVVCCLLLIHKGQKTLHVENEESLNVVKVFTTVCLFLSSPFSQTEGQTLTLTSQTLSTTASKTFCCVGERRSLPPSGPGCDPFPGGWASLGRISSARVRICQ